MSKEFFSRREAGNTVDWSTELSRFRAECTEDPALRVGIATKQLADAEIRRRIHTLHFENPGAGFPAAQALFFERARDTDSDEGALLAISMRGVMTIVKTPTGSRS